MRYSGYADEAADSLAGQIDATRRLGWDDIELRRVDGTPVFALSEDAFDRMVGTLAEAQMRVHCLGSTIANGARRFDDPQESSLAEAIALVPRMRRLGTRYVRLMSWPLLENKSLAEQLSNQRIESLRQICARFIDAGMVPVHENCGNWGGLGARFSQELVAAIPGLKLVFDPGNAVRDRDGAAAQPADGSVPRLSAWHFYREVREHVVHVHVKDAISYADGTFRWCWPGEGHAELPRILADLFSRGYDQVLTIEPHLFTGSHHGLPAEEAKARTYVEYGFRTMAMVGQVFASLAAAGQLPCSAARTTAAGAVSG
jgi:sugar phosphate isomerase/epimerase